MEITTNTTPEHIQKKCENLYKKSMGDVLDYCNSLGLQYFPCKPCEDETPTIVFMDHATCAVCGTVKPDVITDDPCGMAVHYRGKKYLVRSITYHPVNEPGELCNSLVSTDELNGILNDDTQSKNEGIQSAAMKLDNAIAFFLPEGEIKNTTAAFVLKCLNNDFPEFVFTQVDI